MVIRSTRSPTALKWWFAVVLRGMREAAGITREDAARAVKGSVSGIGHIEVGRTLPKPLELDTLLALYGQGSKAEVFQELRTRAKRGSDWWIGLQGVEIPKEFGIFLGLESSAAQIDGWDLAVVPGLCQTADYSRELLHGARTELPAEEIDQRVELRLARQHEVLDEGHPPLICRVITEAALRSQVGSREVMRAQLEHLADLAERPTVKICVLPLTAGAHPGIEGSFTILSAPAEMDGLDGFAGVVHVETLVEPYFHDAPADVRRYQNVFVELRARALDHRKSPAYIRRIAKEL